MTFHCESPPASKWQTLAEFNPVSSGADDRPTATPEREEFLSFNRQSDCAEFNEVAVFAENASF
ncbi:MAG: hypothetical protein Q8M16_17275 [Pirellulaceae bacterium]|nr:hypothetical protein [Pirellulaceae bacterium]